MQTNIEEPVTQITEDRQFKSRRWLSPILLLTLVAVLGGLLLIGIIPRLTHAKQLEQAAAARIATVSVAIATPGDATTELILPSSVEAAQETPLYPRVNGYVKRIVADIGAKVNAGDVLAEIETPELDQQVNQAKAAVEQAIANLTLATTSYGRWQAMQNSRIVAAQEVDERKGALDARKADRTAAEANLQRLTRTQGYQKITAPFAGTVTKRFVEVGQLVTGDLNDSTRILFRIEHTAALRAFINVPQSYYRNISVGQTVALSFREVPGRTFPGTVVRTAGALDSATRTLRTEIQVPNEAGELIPGLYAEVKFQVQREHPPITVPARAVIIQSAGPQIATVNDGNRVTLHSVALGRDFGKTVEIASGVEPGARFILNPTDTLRDGATVQVEVADAPKLAAK
jgi:RND family efflux transporter MFP subunit